MKTRNRKLARFEPQIQRAYARGVKIGGIYKQILEAGADCSLIALKKFVCKHKLFWEAPLDLAPLPKSETFLPVKNNYFAGTNWWTDLTKDGKELFHGTSYHYSSLHKPDAESITPRIIFEANKYLSDPSASGRLKEIAQALCYDVCLTIMELDSYKGFEINYGKHSNCKILHDQFVNLPRFTRREKIVEDVLAGKMFPIILEWFGDRKDTVIKEYAFPSEINQAVIDYGKQLADMMYIPVPAEFLAIYTNEKLLRQGTENLQVVNWK